MQIPSLLLSRDTDYDYLSAVEFGRVLEGQPPRCWQPLSEQFAFYRPPRTRRARGFLVKSFDDFDPEDPAVAAPAASPCSSPTVRRRSGIPASDWASSFASPPTGVEGSALVHDGALIQLTAFPVGRDGPPRVVGS
jgi:hypothetical protein